MQQDSKRYATYEEAEADQLLCETCGKKIKSVIGCFGGKDNFNHYILEECDVVPCRIHCLCRRQGDVK